MGGIDNVQYSSYQGGGDITTWIKAACASAGVPFSNFWLSGLTELCTRESSLRPNAVNTTDSNATGPTVADGHPRDCSRGIAQCIPETFARYHASATSWQIYDPIANIAAAIGYVIARYGVQQDGSNLASRVQQADASRPPKGYTIINAANYCMCLTNTVSGRRAAIDKTARWQPRDPISIRYLDGETTLRDRVTRIALEWTKIADLRFDFVDDGPSDVRISFTPGNGSWSYIGTVCKTIPEPEPTMNYGWLTADSDEAEVRRVVLHEFGHAIGLIHEHVNPKGGIHWNRAAVYHDLGGPPNNWDKDTIDNNMFKCYSLDEVIATEVDPISIMMYPIPKAWTTDGFSAGLNSELSDIDKSLVSSAYPK